MERERHSPIPEPEKAGSWTGKVWLAIWFALVVWQGWMTLTLFGPDQPWQHLLDDQPIISGRHPLHLYHGYLGARSFYDQGTLCCYDPHYQAGYPKTPVFDNGSRPAELFLLVGGGTYRPAAYKVGLALVSFAVPFFLVLAARGAGLHLGTACLATALGQLVWWSDACQSLLMAGDLHLLLAALALLAQAGLLVRFDSAPSFSSWLGIVLTGALGWFAHPLIFVLIVPLILVYYFRVGGRHHLVWHLALLVALGGAVAGNIFWLGDWVNSWWIRVPFHLEGGAFTQRSLFALLDASLWGGTEDRAFALVLIGLAGMGVWHLNHVHQRQAARLFGLGMTALLVVALAAIVWEPLGRLQAHRLLAGALLMGAVPAAHALVQLGQFIVRCTGSYFRAALVTAAFLVVVGLAASEPLSLFAMRFQGATPLPMGLGPEREALVAGLREHTNPGARILWEDRPASQPFSSWTPLLALRTERAFLGGLDPSAKIEHTHHTSFNDQMLAGRLIGDWKDSDLEDYCQRYNIGWIVCWSSAAQERLRTWKRARQVTQLQDQGSRYLFAIDRPHSFALQGSQARWLQADHRHIALADLVPNAEGEVVLSLHYQAGMRVSPSRVTLDKELDPYDPIPFVRLRIPGPVVRVTLTWEK